jgi:CheY-like chemotaxis protein
MEPVWAHHADMRARVLVVDDVGAPRRSSALALELEGYRVYEAAHLDEAFQIATFSQPDVLVADARAIRDAPGTFRRLKAHARLGDLLVLALDAGVQGRQELIEGGVHGVVGKPAGSTHLVAAVRWVLEVYRHQDAVGH